MPWEAKRRRGIPRALLITRKCPEPCGKPFKITVDSKAEICCGCALDSGEYADDKRYDHPQ